MTPGPELWKRVETHGDDTRFTWMVWSEGNSLDGDTFWFQDDEEAEARAKLDSLSPASATETGNPSTPEVEVSDV